MGSPLALPPIPFNRTTPAGNELRHIQEALRGGQIAGDLTFSKCCQRLLEEALGVGCALLTTSCTHALEMAALLLEIQSGDEVIVPSFTFPSTANAFVLRGARPVFADIRPDTLNLDERKLEPLISPRTRAVIAVHYAGVGCTMDRILEIATRHQLSVIEDNAHGLFGKYQGRYLGTFGRLATQSFHATKNFTCGEGGALLINDGSLVERAAVIREKGTDRSRFFRGQVDKYTWIDVGSSYVVSDVLAAFLLGQLEQWQRIQARRRALWEYYRDQLRNWAGEHDVRLPVVPPECDQAYHIFYLLLPSLAARQGLIDHLKRRGISAIFHYHPLHLSAMGARFGARAGDCPVAEAVSDRLVRLPLFHDLSEREQARIVGAIHEYRMDRAGVAAKPFGAAA